MSIITPLIDYFAQVNINKEDTGLGGLPTELTSTNVENGLVVAFGIAGGIALIIIAYGGFKFVTSQGNPQEVTKAKNTIIDGFIGLCVIVGAGGIVGFVVSVLSP
jgi:type IV secretion system pilin